MNKSSDKRHPALTEALEQGYETLFQHPNSAPFRKTVPAIDADIDMAPQIGSTTPFAYDVTVQYGDGHKEQFIYY